jgi:hypothetical protein
MRIPLWIRKIYVALKNMYAALKNIRIVALKSMYAALKNMYAALKNIRSSKKIQIPPSASTTHHLFLFCTSVVEGVMGCGGRWQNL